MWGAIIRVGAKKLADRVVKGMKDYAKKMRAWLKEYASILKDTAASTSTLPKGMSIKFKWKNDNRAAVARKVREATAKGLAEAAEYVLEQANRTVPIEEGTLMRSGGVALDGANMRAVVFYDTPYAVRQHEDTRLGHNQGRRAKWLEQTMRETQKEVQSIIVRHLRDAMR
ncbi:MAG TPA: hypothetical protein VM262_14315 [Acidimicrobiales bacterium]|nr:hypothetical protein [Acidimicrobiales bacterium]